MFMGIWRDVKLAVRSLAKARAFTFVCVISLGIGMVPVIAVPYGARMFTTAPPGLNTDSLVEVVTTPQGPRQASSLWSYPDFAALRDANTGITLTGWARAPVELTLDPSLGGKIETQALFVSLNYFSTLGVAMAQGAGLRDTADPIVVMTQGFWQRRLGSDPAAVGKEIVINQVPHTIVGIAQYGFSGHLSMMDTGLYVPLDRHPRVLADTAVRFDRSVDWVNIHGRLSPGTTIEQARGVVVAVTAQLATGTVEPYDPLGSVDGDDFIVVRTVLQTLTTLPLLVVCLNIAGMVQVRSAMRERELSIRQAIGASRGRLMQQLLAESVVLAALGATLASLTLFNLAPLTAWWANEPLPPAMAAALQVDLSMIAVCVGLCLATSLVFGWLPAARFSRPVIITVLKDDAGGGGTRAGRVHRVATALQVAIATPLLVLSAMTLDRVRATATDDLGFASDSLYAAPMNLDAFENENAWLQVRTAREALAQSGGVASVTLADGTPLDFRYRITRVATAPVASPGNDAPKILTAHVTRVGNGYLETLGITLFRGRDFGVEDGAGAEGVALISQPLADRLFPGDEVVGKKMAFAAGEKTERVLTIVGVTSDFPTSQMSTGRAQVLVPLAQHSNVKKDSVNVNDDRGGGPRLMLIARSAPGEPAAKLTAALEHALRDLDPEFESASIVTGVWLRQNSVRDFMNQSAAAGIVGGILLLLAALGIYGVVGLMVATRIREIAVRVALGASRRRVMGMVLFDVVKLVLPGVGIGLLLAVAFVKLNGEDFGISLSHLEPLAYVVGAAIAVLIAIAASLAPARRAASVQPMIAMRSE
ncbi:MAG: ABC transporter permease [Acidobacteria bacterium]|nr:ABC transporter permease [Acidobacteriota bacterium]